MKLYHGTSIEKAESIMENGFWMTSNDESKCDREIDSACVYGFSSIEEAQNFAFDQCFDNHAVICFEVGEAEADPEYGGEAFYTTETPANFEIVYTHDNGEEWTK